MCNQCSTPAEHLKERIIYMNLKGLKNTPARTALISFLSGSKSPVDVNTLYEVMSKMGFNIDLATLYRNLNLFVDKKILNKVEFMEGKYRYELSSLPHHHHLICEYCGKVKDIETCDLELLEETVYKKQGFRVQNHRVEFYGLCRSCQS